MLNPGTQGGERGRKAESAAQGSPQNADGRRLSGARCGPQAAPKRRSPIYFCDPPRAILMIGNSPRGSQNRIIQSLTAWRRSSELRTLTCFERPTSSCGPSAGIRGVDERAV